MTLAIQGKKNERSISDVKESYNHSGSPKNHLSCNSTAILQPI